MEDITLQQLLEAGCHFGHKAERWNPKAASFIYAKKDGIHIIDLAQTRNGLLAAMQFVHDTVAAGGEVLFVGTKRQASGIVKEQASRVGAPYFSQRWIGGFLTNWDAIKKNIEKANKLAIEQTDGSWKKFPKHEQVQLAKYLTKLQIFYGGVLGVKAPPAAVFIVDVKKEQAALREAKRTGATLIAMVDTNADPVDVQYVIPANDDAVGSVTLVTHALATAYAEGREARAKETAALEAQKEKAAKQTEKPAEEKAQVVAPEVAVPAIEQSVQKKKPARKKKSTNQPIN